MIKKSCFLKYPFSYFSFIIYIGFIFAFIPTLSLAQDEESLLRKKPDFVEESEPSVKVPDNKEPMVDGAEDATKKGNRFGIYSMACTTIQNTVLNLACNQKAYKDATKPVTDRIRQMQANNSNGSQKDQCQLVQQANEKVKEMNQAITGKCHTAILSCKTTCGMALKNAKVAHAAAIEPTAKAMFWAEMTAISKSMTSCASKWASVKKTSDLQNARNTNAIKQTEKCVDGLGGASELSDSSNCNQLPQAQKTLCQQLGEVAFCKQNPKIDFCRSLSDSLLAGKTNAPGPGHTNANASSENPLKQTLTGGGTKV